MTKKNYQTPCIEVVRVDIRQQLLSGSGVAVNQIVTNTNTGITIGGGGDGTDQGGGVPQSRRGSVWDDEENDF